MKVEIIGCKDDVLKHVLLRAAKFFGHTLLSRQMLPHIELEIVMKTTIPDLGSCAVTHYNDWYKPRYFEIELRRHCSFKNTITTLAHEMVHLKQFAKGELAIYQDKWHKKIIDTDVVPYAELPWEIEASTLEHALYSNYIETFGKPKPQRK
jgi:hypothetical protein